MAAYRSGGVHASVRNTSQAARCDRRARAGRQTKPGDCLDLCHLPSLASAANRRARQWPPCTGIPAFVQGSQGSALGASDARCTAAVHVRGEAACALTKSGSSARCTPSLLAPVGRSCSLTCSATPHRQRYSVGRRARLCRAGRVPQLSPRRLARVLRQGRFRSRGTRSFSSPLLSR